MPQLFSRSEVLIVKLILLVPLALIVLVVLGMIRQARAPVEEGIVVEQPIAFSHKHHVGDDGIDCRYCHTSVENSATAGMPSTGICLSCHSQLYRDAPELAPLHESARTGTPIQWNRVHDLPDFVFFNHSIHVNKGVACITCHGHVDRMPLMVRAEPLDMQWCLACHRNPAAHVGPPDQVFSMTVPQLGPRERENLLRMLSLESTRRLTDCSTCHR